MSDSGAILPYTNKAAELFQYAKPVQAWIFGPGGFIHAGLALTSRQRMRLA